VRFGQVLEFILKNSEIPAVVLTNGTMLHIPEVREAARNANVVKVSLSAWDQVSYRWVNRPHPELDFKELFEAQRSFRERFKGELWMEVFLVAGMNSTPADVDRIAVLAEEIKPDRIQLNTTVRPAAEAFAEALPLERLTSLCRLFRPTAEVIPEFRTDKDISLQASKEEVLAMLRRRPCTAYQIAEGFGMHLNEVSKYLGNLVRTGQIHAKRENAAVYYAADGDGKEKSMPIYEDSEGVHG